MMYWEFAYLESQLKLLGCYQYQCYHNRIMLKDDTEYCTATSFGMNHICDLVLVVILNLIN